MLLVVPMAAYGQGLKAFKLQNGMSVFIWEDDSQPDVFGQVVVRTGSVNDPAEYTGLAHYLEHLLFKGTQKIGALDWAAEEPLYNQIIEKYDEMALTTDPAQREAIGLEINRLSIEAGKLSMTNEFSNLIEGMGGTGLNAYTSYDVTAYHNSFPAYQLNKWLEIASERFVNPVFRSFQSELETVYEEYNRGNDNPQSRTSQFFFEKVFEGHPYSRSVIGLGEHLKNPRISKLIEYYNNWYVPENMALILVGNVKTTGMLKARIMAAFGKLEARPVPQRVEYPDFQIKGRKQFNTKMSQYPSVLLAYNGVKKGHPDELPLEICLSLLSNSGRCGALDRMTVNGEFMFANASLLALREQGRVMVQAVPNYDENQRRFESNKSVEKKLLTTIGELAEGKVEPWLLDAVKLNLCRDFDLSMESSDYKAQILLDAFVNETDLGESLAVKDRIMAVTMDDIKRVAKTYLQGENYMAFYNDMGTPDKVDKIAKPAYKPIEPPVGKSSAYADKFRTMPTAKVADTYVDWSKMQEAQINDYSHLYYTTNDENDVYTLTLKYGAGSHVFPLLEYAASLMDNAGVMGNYEPQQLKEELSRLNATCSVRADDSYLYVTMHGYEETLVEACQLLTRQLLMPKLDDKQLSSLKGSLASNRMARKKNVNMLGDALNQYIMYGENSEYRNEITDQQIIDMKISTLTGDINRAAGYEAEIHYSGTLPFETVYNVLSTSLPLVAGEKKSDSPVVRTMQTYTENTVFFLPNSEGQQSQIYFYIPMGTNDTTLTVKRMAFGQYIGGGFNGLIMDEIREKNSMAYTAYGQPTTQGYPGSEVYFTGYVGTQNDKAIDAIKLYLDILTNMDARPERIDNIKSFLRQALLSQHPTNRSLSSYIVNQRRRGYTDDPVKSYVPKIDALTFDDIMDYYNTQLKGRPIVIGIVGNPKFISADALKAFGKVIKLSDKKLFNEEGVLFQ